MDAMVSRRLFTAAASATAASALLPRWAAAQNFQPGKPVRLVIPFAPGQGSDILARAIAQQLGQRWNLPVTVDNKPGANGSIAATEVARAPGDGHTILVTSNSPIVINPNLYKKLNYDVQSDLRGVKLMGFADLAILVNAQVPARTLPELVALLKSRPGKLSFGSPGIGSTSHMASQLFMQVTGTDMVHVTYKGSGPAMTDLICGQIEVMTDALPSALATARGGRVRMLSLTGTRPSSFAPEVPTAASQGITGLPAGGWYGVFVPASTPAALVERMGGDLNAVMQAPEMVTRLKDQFIEPAPAGGTLASFAEFVRSDTAFWEATTRRLNLYHSE